MKKLYRKSSVHPSPPPAPPSADPLDFLPAALLALAAALTDEDREVLAYLLSVSSTPKQERGAHHAPASACDCFGCYTSFWARWDSSPNRHLIHRIIDAFEDPPKPPRTRRDRGKKPPLAPPSPAPAPPDLPAPETVRDAAHPLADEDQDKDKGSLNKFVSFLGDRIWGFWA